MLFIWMDIFGSTLCIKSRKSIFSRNRKCKGSTAVVTLPCLGNSGGETVKLPVVLVLSQVLRIIFRALSEANREFVYTVAWHKTTIRYST